MNRTALPLVLSLVLSLAAPALSQTTGTPAQVVTLTANGTSAVVPIDATVWAGSANIMLAAPGGGTLELDGAPTAAGPFTPLGIVVTKGATNTFDSTANTLTTTWGGYNYAMHDYVPFVRLTATALTGSATLAIAMAIR